MKNKIKKQKQDSDGRMANRKEAMGRNRRKEDRRGDTRRRMLE